MKKILLLSLALASLSLSAGTLKNVEKKQATTAKMAPARTLSKDAVKSLRKAKGNGAYYAMPQGTMGVGLTSEWGYYYASFYAVAPYTDIKLTNQSTVTGNTVWSIPQYELPELPGEYTGQFQVDPETKDLTIGGFTAGYELVTPTLTIDDATYLPSSGNETYQYGVFEAFTEPWGLAYYSAPDQTIYSYAGTDEVTDKPIYCYGTGCTITEDDGTVLYEKGVYQTFPKPMNILTVNQIYLPAVSWAEVPIADGAYLTLDVLETSYDEEGNLVYGDTIASMKCTSEDITKVGAGDLFGYYTISFSKKVLDDFGGEIIEPFDITTSFVCILRGFDKEGINLGLTEVENLDQFNSPTRMILADAEGNPGPAYYWIGDEYNTNGQTLSTCWTFEALQNYGEVYMFSSLVAPTAGGFAVSPENEEVNYIPFYSAAPWIDEDDNESYYFDTDADWFELSVDTSVYFSEDLTGMNAIMVNAEALPENVSSRKATVEIKTLGGTTVGVFEVGQGDVELSVKSVASREATKNKRFFNLRGQQVADKTKGIVISNGKKYLNR